MNPAGATKLTVGDFRPASGCDAGRAGPAGRCPTRPEKVGDAVAPNLRPPCAANAYSSNRSFKDMARNGLEAKARKEAKEEEGREREAKARKGRQSKRQARKPMKAEDGNGMDEEGKEPRKGKPRNRRER